MIRHNSNNTRKDVHCSVAHAVVAGSFETATLDLRDAEELLQLPADDLRMWVAHYLLFPMQRHKLHHTEKETS